MSIDSRYKVRSSSDPEFRKKNAEYQRNYYLTHKEKMMEYNREYQRKYRALRKLAKQNGETK